MLRKSLLASIALVSLNPIQASQATPQHHAPTHHAHNNDHNNEKAPSHCPPCPCGGVTGWVLIPAGPGMPCNQNAGKHDEEAEGKPSGEPAPDTAAPHHHNSAKLAAQLKAEPPHIYLRANPHSPDPKKKEGEWGKELKGKVYFKELGNWVHDPSVEADKDEKGNPNPHTDMVKKRDIKAEARAMDAAKRPPQSPQKPAPAIVARPAVAPAGKPAVQEAPAERPAPPSTAGRVPPPPPLPPPSNEGSTSSDKISGNKGGYKGRHHEVKLPARLIPTVPHATSNLGSQGDQVYPSVVPGARGTPEEKLNPVNRQP